KALADQSAQIDKLKAQLTQAELDTKAQQGDLDKLRSKTASEGPVIRILSPEVYATRDVQLANRILQLQETVDVVGLVDAAAGLTRFTINGKPENVARNGVFRTPLKITNEVQTMRIAAADKGGRLDTLQLTLSPEGKLTVSAEGAGAA